jgi:hypothetical protein
LNITPGIITGVSQSIIDNPIEVIKLKLMTGNSKNIQISTLYQGFNFLILRNIFFAIPVAYSVKNYGKENSFLAGAVGGIIGSVISHPFDVLKTERQREKTLHNKKITLYNILISNPKSLLSGILIRSTISFINMGIGFMIFNSLYRNLYNIMNNKEID